MTKGTVQCQVGRTLDIGKATISWLETPMRERPSNLCTVNRWGYLDIERCSRIRIHRAIKKKRRALNERGWKMLPAEASIGGQKFLWSVKIGKKKMSGGNQLALDSGRGMSFQAPNKQFRKVLGNAANRPQTLSIDLRVRQYGSKLDGIPPN